MSNFINEIEEELEIERILKFFSKYYIIMILFIISVLIILGLYISKNKNQIKNNENAANIYSKILNKIEKKDYSNIIEEFDYIMKNNQSGYYIISSLNKASYLKKENKNKEAIEIYDMIFSNKKIDSAMRYIAKLNSLTLKNDITDIENSNPSYISSMMIKLDHLVAIKNYNEAIATADIISLDQRSNQNIKKKMKIVSNILKNN